MAHDMGLKSALSFDRHMLQPHHGHVGGWGNTMGCSCVEVQGEEASCVDGVGGKQEYEAGTMDGWMVMKGKHEDFLNGIYFNWIER